jgi:hypothetical protein
MSRQIGGRGSRARDVGGRRTQRLPGWAADVPGVQAGVRHAHGGDPHQRCGVTEPQAREPGKGTRGGKIWLTANGTRPATGSFRSKDAADPPDAGPGDAV